MTSSKARRPRLTRAQRSENLTRISLRLKAMEAYEGIKTRVNSNTHITVWMSNGERVEIYPTVIGLQVLPKRGVRYFDVDGLFDELRAIGAFPSAMDDEDEVIE